MFYLQAFAQLANGQATLGRESTNGEERLVLLGGKLSLRFQLLFAEAKKFPHRIPEGGERFVIQAL